MFSDINSASVFVSRRRVSSPRCARSVLRIDTAPQRNDAICARFDASFTVSRRERFARFARFAPRRLPSPLASSLRKPRSISRAGSRSRSRFDSPRPSLSSSHRANRRSSPPSRVFRGRVSIRPRRVVRSSRPTHQTQQKHRRPVPPLALSRRRVHGVHDAVDDEHHQRPRRHEPHVRVASDERALLELFLRHHDVRCRRRAVPGRRRSTFRGGRGCGARSGTGIFMKTTDRSVF